MKKLEEMIKRPVNRRSFLKNGIAAAGAATVGAGLLAGGSSVLGRERQDDGPDITRGDVAILQFLAAAELIESDLWQQYNELGGVDAANSGYVAALSVLDGDMPQYIADNTDDEISHETFLNAYLASKGAYTVNLDQFAPCRAVWPLGPSKSDGSRTSCNSRWIPAGGLGTVACETQILAPRSLRQSRV